MKKKWNKLKLHTFVIRSNENGSEFYSNVEDMNRLGLSDDLSLAVFKCCAEHRIPARCLQIKYRIIGMSKMSKIFHTNLCYHSQQGTLNGLHL